MNTMIDVTRPYDFSHSFLRSIGYNFAL